MPHRGRVEMSGDSGRPVEIQTLSVGSMDNNVYILRCPDTGEGVIVDAAAEAERILEAAEGTPIRYILQTHGHRDHVQALAELKRVLGAPVGVHRDDAEMLPVIPDFFLVDGDRITFGAQELLVIHTPGHTPGGVCFLVGRTLISGDTLFPGGPGATATTLGNFQQIIESIRERLFTLPDDTTVLPGHGRSTTIGAEKPYLEDWIARGW
jgi:glyoxylase-like metal-dependent hydrolase (beta-lactamase superfamily II)